MLEGSKGFVKDLCIEAGIPTAAYRRFTAPDAAKAFADTLGYPVVIKADGLAAGKGVIIAATRAEADKAIDFMFEGGFGASGHEIVVEEFMEGEEASFFALSDGTHVIPLGGGAGPQAGGRWRCRAQYRRHGSLFAGAGADAGIGTRGGWDRFIKPTVAAFAAKGRPYMGVLYLGLMITKTGPKLVEYNARFGDPECQVLMPRLKSDLLAALLAARDGTLDKLDLNGATKPL